MSDSQSRKNLGRGLSALFGEETEDYAELDRVRANKEVPIEHLHPNPKQPRQIFDDAAVAELSDSIKANGLLQAILVRRHPERPSEYEIVAGERRWRAAQKAQLHSVPVVIRELSDAEALELALVENLQRQDLSPLEEAEAYERLIEEYKHTQDALGRAVGKSRSHVANTLRLLTLPKGVKDLLNDGSLSAGHARALLGVEGAEALAKEIVKKQLNVRQTEQLAQQSKAGGSGGGKSKAKKAKPSISFKDADTLALERDLSNLLGMRVNIEIDGQGGSLIVHYGNLDQLDDLLRRLNQGGAAVEPDEGI